MLRLIPNIAEKRQSRTGLSIIPNDLHAYYQMKKLERVIVKFKCHKHKNFVMYKRKNLGNKSQELTNLKLFGRPFAGESMSHKNQQLACK